MKLSHIDVRTTFLDYFAKRGHRIVRSSSLIPHGDPTLMFTNAGMNQFKNVFLGLEKRDYNTATSSQKCLRVTGKHNDFEEVGRTARHHTFFEMLGNFSFGDYFKKEAIRFAWELCTETFKLNPERFYVTVYLEDDEAHKIWETEVGFPSERIYRLGKKDNYWSMGPTGPNGPCSELHYDMNPPNGHLRTAEEIERGGDDAFVELWNLVFMQYNTREDGVTEPLPNPSIDTGAGLERLTATLQGVISNYDTDLFMPYISAVADLAGVNYGDEKSRESSVSVRVIADHLRAMSFLIADGAMPSNEGRGYVLRRIIRRAIRHGRLIGLTDPFLHMFTGLVAEEMKTVYPEVPENQSYIFKVVLSEEERFGRAFENSYKYFYEEGIEPLKTSKKLVVPGEVIFKAYDTYGMPLDLAQEIASEHGMTIDESGFQKLLQGQRERARASWKGSGEEKAEPVFHEILEEHGLTEFLGYKDESVDNVKILALVQNGKRVERLDTGAEGKIVLDRTPYYAESGGQVGDTGRLHTDGISAIVTDTAKVEGKLHVHEAKVEAGELKVGQTLQAEIDSERRAAIKANHTVTHIMQWALRDLLGEHIKQAGSLVAPDRVRFDFTHFSAMDRHELELFERAVNRRIRESAPVRWEFKPLEEAIEEGVTALFGEKYEDVVRVVWTGDYSAELCGGTHVSNTGEIGLFHVLSESSVAAGVRRIEAVTAESAVERVQSDRELIEETSAILKSTPEELANTVKRMVADIKALQKEVKQLKIKLASGESKLGGSADTSFESSVGPYKIYSQISHSLDPSTMKNLADEIRRKIKSGVVLLGDDSGGKATLVLAATDDVTDKINCGKLIKDIARHINGGGGGSSTMAQAGGKGADKIPEAVSKGRELIATLLK